jgi:phage terminase small subunit
VSLTLKQEAFCSAYIETGGNASEAYRRVYDVSPDCKPNTVEKRACELLKNGKVAGRIAALRAEISKRLEITADKVVRELALIGFANMADYIKTQDDGSAYVDLSKLTREQAAAIGEVTSETYFEGKGDEAVPVKRTKFKLSDKRAALVDLGRHLGLFEKDNTQAAKAAAEAAAQAEQPSDRALARAILSILHTAKIEKDDNAA